MLNIELFPVMNFTQRAQWLRSGALCGRREKIEHHCFYPLETT